MNSEITKKVALVIINPTEANGSGVIEKYNWKSPQSLADSYISAIKDVSDGLISYEIETVKILNLFPEKKSGFTLDHNYYKKCQVNPDYNCRELIDYRKFFDKLNLCEDISQGKINEIWAFNGPWFGFWEWSVKGKISSLQENLPDCGGKTYTIMGFSYERSLSEMLEDLGHRFEAVMIQIPRVKKDWALFTSRKYCGSVHIPPNGVKDYDWSNPKTVTSYCESFLTFPSLSDSSSELSCNTWDCTGEGYFKWWFRHFPEEWWKYVLDTDNSNL